MLRFSELNCVTSDDLNPPQMTHILSSALLTTAVQTMWMCAYDSFHADLLHKHPGVSHSL